MSSSGSSELLLAPRDAATWLEVAPSTLRRLATVYVQVYGADSLPWSDGGKGGGARLWSGDALRRTKAARDLVEAGRAASFELALRMLKDAPADALTAYATPSEVGEVAALRDEVAGLRAALEALQDEVASMRALPPAADPERVDAIETEMLEGRAEAERDRDGLLVRVARWIEKRVRG